MVVETMDEYELSSAEVAYKNPGEQAPMVSWELGVEIQGSENTSTWMDRKFSYLHYPPGTDNTRWETATV